MSEAARAPYFSGIDLPGCAPPLRNCCSAVRTRRYRSASLALRLKALAEPAAHGRKRQLGQIGRSFHMELFPGMAMGMAVPLPENGVCHAQLLPHHPTQGGLAGSRACLYLLAPGDVHQHTLYTKTRTSFSPPPMCWSYRLERAMAGIALTSSSSVRRLPMIILRTYLLLSRSFSRPRLVRPGKNAVARAASHRFLLCIRPAHA